ncbi:MAG: YgjV family protein [Gemmatimonadota bacterium]
MNDLIGYLATAAVLLSYLFKNPTTLRRVQALAAVLWMLYGILLHAYPVIVANVLITAIAVWSSVKVSKPVPSP